MSSTLPTSFVWLALLSLLAGCHTNLAVDVRDSKTLEPAAGVAVTMVVSNHDPFDWYRHRVVAVTNNSGRAVFHGLANQSEAIVSIHGAETTTSIPPQAKHQQWSATRPAPSPYDVAIHTLENALPVPKD